MTGRYQTYPKLAIAKEIIIEDFPAHWNLTRVKFNSLVKARVGWHGLKSDDFTEVGPYLVTGSDFKGKFIQWEDCYHCDEERYEQDPYIQLTNGDLLITKDGTIGKIALVNELNGKATLNSGVFVVRPLRSDYTTQYYYWLLLSRAFTDFVNYYKTGSTIVHLYQETFVNFKYPLPPYEEQLKIANFLGHETAKIDTLIAKQEKLVELLKEKRRAVISHAVTKGLNPDAPMKKSGVEWLGEVPEHWKVSRMRFLCNITTGNRDTQDAKTDGQYPFFVRSDHIQKCDTFSFDGEGVMTSGDGAGVGKIFHHFNGKCEIHQRVYLFHNFKKITGKYFYHFLKQNLEPIALAQSAKSTVDSLRMPILQEFCFCFGSIEEQKAICEYIDDFEKRVDILISKAKQSKLLLNERKTALISAAVTGKIDVRDWEPLSPSEGA